MPDLDVYPNNDPIPAMARNATIRDAIANIDRYGKGIVLIIDDHGVLLDAVTDGDVRRAILDGAALDAPLDLVLERKKKLSSQGPVWSRPDAPPAEWLRLMLDHGIAQLPLINEDGTIAALVTLADLMPDESPALEAVVMAGGLGTRLRPATEHLPKPMLPLGGKPLLEHTIAGLAQAGIRRVSIATHYLPEKITGHFGDGKSFGVDLSYLSESEPMGTAGALALMPPWDGALLVVNGDLFTTIDYRAMLRFHHELQADFTVGTRPYETTVPYGVIDSDGPLVNAVREKPVLQMHINAGIYLLEPSVRNFIPPDQRFDMTELIRRLLDAGRVVANFPIVECWVDIGRPEDYARARQEAQLRERRL